MTARNTSSTAIEVSWGEVPANKTGGGILGYDVTYIKQSGRGTSIVVVGSLHVTVSKLEKFTIYCVTVAAFTSKGSGNTSKGVYVTTDEEGKVVLACMQAKVVLELFLSCLCVSVVVLFTLGSGNYIVDCKEFRLSKQT